MTPRFLLATTCGLLASACGGPREAPAPAPVETATPVSATVDDATAGTSIIRPAVAQEVQPPAPPPAPTEPPLAATVAFGRGTMLDDDARQTIDMLIARPGFADAGAITLSGHTDSAGADRANLVTARRRAQAVADYLVAQGVDRARITIIALGERRPVAPNANADGSDFEEGRLRNRRVGIVVAPAASADIAQNASPIGDDAASIAGDGLPR